MQTDDVLAGRPEGIRQPFTEADFDTAIFNNPGKDQFLIDSEVHRLVLNVTYGLTKNFQFDLEIPYLRESGGYLDGFIQNFHDNFGFDQAGRDTLFKDDSTQALFLNGQKLFISSFEESGLSDVVLSAKIPLYRSHQYVPLLNARFAVKFPTGDEEKLLGSGNYDWGFNLYATKIFKKSCIHGNFGVVIPGDWDLFPDLDISNVYSILIAWEYVPRSNISILIQDLAQTSYYKDATDSPLSKVSHEISVGIKMSIRKDMAWVFSFTENHAELNTSPDIGFHVGFLALCCD